MFKEKNLLMWFDGAEHDRIEEVFKILMEIKNFADKENLMVSNIDVDDLDDTIDFLNELLNIGQIRFTED